jgi:siroheme synthase (precorrin-2 oxidase/ferrochelatase)
MDRVLVAHGSKYGATAEIADAVGAALQANGLQVDEERGIIRRRVARSMPEAMRDRRDWDEIAAWAAGIAAVLVESDRA